MVQEMRVGRPKKPSEQRKTERVVLVLTPVEKQRLKQYIDKGSMSEALRETVNIMCKVGLEVRGEEVAHKLDELESFIREIGRVLRSKDIDITIKSKKSVIRIKAGRIFFLNPSTVQEEEGNQTDEGSLVGESIFRNG